MSQVRAEKKSERQNKNGTGHVKLENVDHVLIQTHELGDSYDKGATQHKEQHSVEDKSIDDEQQQQQHPKRTMLQAIGTAPLTLLGAHRYSNSSCPRRRC